MAQPSIKARLQIENGPIWDTFEHFGFIYIESDHCTAAPEKKRETTTYAEQEGENVDPRTVDDVFDYTVKFLLECPNNNLDNANAKIKAFNSAIRDIKDGIKTCKTITFYNDYKRVKIVGIPEIISEPKEFYRQLSGNVLDCVLFELKIHVSTPSLCDFALDSTTEEPVTIRLNIDDSLGYSNAENISQLTMGEGNKKVVIRFDKGSHASYAPRFWAEDNTLRAYKGNTMYFDAGTHLIQTIQFLTKSGTTLHVETEVGNMDDRYWMGNNYYVPFTFTSTTYISSIIVTIR